MTRGLKSGCGSLIEPGNYYWVYFDQKETPGQKRKRQNASRACKNRRRHTRRSSHKLSKSSEEDVNHGIVRITSLEPLCGTFLEWTDTLGLDEDWVGTVELTLVDTVHPLEQSQLGAKVSVASWEERSRDHPSCYYVRTRKPSEGSETLDRAWPHTEVDNTQCRTCQGSIRDDFTVCSNCHVSFHDSCLSPMTPFQWHNGILSDCKKDPLSCVACSQSLRYSSLHKTDSDAKDITICIDLGSSHVKVSTWISGDNEPSTLNAKISSSCWYNGRWHYGDYPSVVSAYSDAVLINPVKRVLLDDPNALQQLRSCGDYSAADIVSGLLEHIFEQIHSERKVRLEPIRAANLHLCIASPAGMTDPQKTVFLSALYECASRVGDLSSQTLPDWKVVFTNVTIVDVPEPECALWEQLEGLLLETHGQRYQVIDIGGFTTCASTFSILPTEPAIRYEASRSLMGGSHHVVQQIMERENLDPGVYSGILNYVIRADRNPSAASEKLCNKNMQASYTASRSHLLDNFKSFIKLVCKELIVLDASNTLDSQRTKVVLTGGGAMDEGRTAIISDQYRGTKVENRGSSNISRSSVLIGLEKYYKVYVSGKRMEKAPTTVLVEQDLEQDSRGYLLVMRAGDPLVNPKLPIAQVRQGEMVLYDLEWKDTDTSLPIYGTTEVVQPVIHNGYYVVKKKPEKLFKIAELSVPRSEDRVGAHKLLKLMINPAARTIQADLIMLDIRRGSEAINYRELTVDSVLTDSYLFKVHKHIRCTIPLSLHGICELKGAQWESESIHWAQNEIVKEVDKNEKLVGRGANHTEAEEETAGELLDIEDVDAEGEPDEWTSSLDASKQEATET